MSTGDEWQVGDLAECLAEKWDFEAPYNPNFGDILRVSKVGMHHGTVAMSFEGKPQRHGWEASAFRKIKPVADPCDAGFAALIKLKTPVKVAA